MARERDTSQRVWASDSGGRGDKERRKGRRVLSNIACTIDDVDRRGGCFAFGYSVVQDFCAPSKP